MPSDTFIAYVEALIIEQEKASCPAPHDVFCRSLWSAASLDLFAKTGEALPVLDGMGLPHPRAAAYTGIITGAVRRIRGDASRR